MSFYVFRINSLRREDFPIPTEIEKGRASSSRVRVRKISSSLSYRTLFRGQSLDEVLIVLRGANVSRKRDGEFTVFLRVECPTSHVGYFAEAVDFVGFLIIKRERNSEFHEILTKQWSFVLFLEFLLLQVTTFPKFHCN